LPAFGGKEYRKHCSPSFARGLPLKLKRRLTGGEGYGIVNDFATDDGIASHLYGNREKQQSWAVRCSRNTASVEQKALVFRRRAQASP